MRFDTKIGVILREDLPTWQKLNVTAFTISGIAGTVEGIIGENYQDASGNLYLPMIVQPILVFSASAEQIKAVYQKAMSSELRFSIYTEELFQTGHDEDNRAAVRSQQAEELKLVGLALRAEKKLFDKICKGLTLHS